MNGAFKTKTKNERKTLLCVKHPFIFKKNPTPLKIRERKIKFGFKLSNLKTQSTGRN